MRAICFLILFIVSGHMHAADVLHSGWVKGPLMEVLADSSLKEVDEYGGSIPIGFAAFEKLAIRKDPETNAWIVSGTVCSTNAGGAEQGKAIYAGYADGHFELVAMSNLKGEVLFSVSPMAGTDAKPIVPTHLYIERYPFTATPRTGEILRRYLLRTVK